MSSSPGACAAPATTALGFQPRRAARRPTRRVAQDARPRSCVPMPTGPRRPCPPPSGAAVGSLAPSGASTSWRPSVPHWAGRNATHLPERLTWPGCRFVRPLGSEQVVAVLQAWRQRSVCPAAGVAVELRWRPLSGTRVSAPRGWTPPTGWTLPTKHFRSARNCVELLRQLPLAPAAGEPCRLRSDHLARTGRGDYPPATAGPPLAHHRAALPSRRGDACGPGSRSINTAGPEASRRPNRRGSGNLRGRVAPTRGLSDNRTAQQ